MRVSKYHNPAKIKGLSDNESAVERLFADVLAGVLFDIGSYVIKIPISIFSPISYRNITRKFLCVFADS